MLAILITAIVFPQTAYAATYTVTNLNDSGAGSLREAIGFANATTANDIIDFNVPGVIELTSGVLTINNNGTLTINGGGNITVTRNSASSFGIFSVSNGTTATFNGLTITNGNAGNGAGIHIGNSTTVRIDGSTISGNVTSGVGGGVRISNSTLTIANSTISGNSATRGGGIDADNTTLTLEDSVLTDNRATGGNGGGGIYTGRSTTLTVTGSIFSTNSASGGTNGGAIMSAVTISGSVTSSCIVGNSDNAIVNSGAGTTLNATGNWWGSSWGPYILSAPTGSGSRVSQGDSISGTGQASSSVNVGIVTIPAHYGDYDIPPTSNWLTTAPEGCGVCQRVSGVGRTPPRVCPVPPPSP